MSNDFNSDYYYKRIVNHNISHSILGGGVYYLEGVKTNHLYEWQKVTSYSLHENRRIRKFERYKNEGNWSNWVGIGSIISGFTTTSVTYNFGYYYPTLVIFGNSNMFKLCICSNGMVTEIHNSSDFCNITQNNNGDITLTSENGMNLGYTLIGWD